MPNQPSSLAESVYIDPDATPDTFRRGLVLSFHINDGATSETQAIRTSLLLVVEDPTRYATLLKQIEAGSHHAKRELGAGQFDALIGNRSPRCGLANVSISELPETAQDAWIQTIRESRLSRRKEQR